MKSFKRSVLTALLVLFVFVLNAFGQNTKAVIPVKPVVLKALNYDVPTRISPPQEYYQKKARNTPAAATFNVTYVGFAAYPTAQAAFQRAVDIWASILTSSVTITVEAKFESLDATTLGSASASTFVYDDPGMPAGTLYSIALGEMITGTNLKPTYSVSYDINASFNKDLTSWYFGIDGNCPAGKYDFVTVVLHELCHGLGFSGTMSYDGAQGSWGFTALPGEPAIYDRFIYNNSNQQIINTALFPNPSPGLGTQLRGGNLYFNGTNTKSQNGGVEPKLYSPSTWDAGSSIAHFDEDTYSGAVALMTPFLGMAEAIHDPGPLTKGVFKDLGWNLTLATTYSISGTITSGGMPLSGVTVNITGSSTAMVTTGADGTYSFTGLSSGGNYTVTPTKTNYTFSPTNQTFNNVTSNQTQNFTATSTTTTYTISGTISSGGNPLSGVSVSCPGANTTTPVTTDATGTYTFTVNSSGNYTVTPTKTNYSFSPISQTYSNIAGNQTQNFTATINKFTISGAVGIGGEPLSGVLITLSGGKDSTMTTGIDGIYSFTVNAAGNYTVTPTKTNYSFTPASQTFNNVTSNQIQNFTATSSTFSISGTVKDAGGIAIAGVKLYLTGSKTDSTTSGTDIDGSYTFTGLATGGNYTITPSKTYYTFAPITIVNSNLSQNKTAQNFVGTLQTFSISGSVKDGSGIGISGTKVKLTGGKTDSVTTDATGNYTFTALTAGLAYTVTPTKTNYSFTPASVSISTLNDNKTAQNFTGSIVTYSISGYIRDVNNNGVSGAKVFLSVGRTDSVTTDANGFYSFSNLPAGVNYTITPSKLNYSFNPTKIDYLSLSDNKTGANFTATLTTYGISGFVKDTANNALANAKIYLSVGKTDSTTVDNFGMYSFVGLAPGINYTVTPSMPYYTFTPTSTPFTNLGEYKVNVNFTGKLVTFSISGIVKDDAGNPISGAKVKISQGKNDSTTTDAAGVFTFSGLFATQTYVLTPSKTNYSFNPINSTVSNLTSSVSGITFTGSLFSFGISGAIQDNLTAAISGAKVYLTGSKIDSTTTDVSGNYGFSGLTAGGNYTVTPQKAYYTMDPVNRSITNLGKNETNLNFTGTLITFSISGSVKDILGNGLTGVKIKLTGGKTDSATTDLNGAYSFNGLSATLTYNLVPSKTNYNFSPTNTSIVLTENKPNTNFTASLLTYSISGKVKDISGTGLQGVRVKISGGKSDSLDTDASGNYTFTNLAAGGNFTITPAKANYLFVPSNQQFNSLSENKSSIDFTGTLSTYGISGFVKDVAGNGMIGVKVRLSDGKTDSTTTDNIGMFVFSDLAAGGNYTVTPYKVNFTFDPPYKSFTNLSGIQSITFNAVNKLPTQFSLVSPVHNEQINLIYPTKSVTFKWQKSIDPDGFSIVYTLAITGTGYSKSYPNISDTTLSADIMTDLKTSSSYTWNVTANDGKGETQSTTYTFKTSASVSSVEKIDGNIPNEFSLKQNYPNPFNPSTNIEFTLPKSSYVTLKIYSVTGKEVANLVSGNLNTGYYKISWDPGNNPSGLYFYKLTTQDFVSIKKLSLIK